MSRTASAAMAAKLATIRAIQQKGFRVFISQKGWVTVWRKGAPEKEWTFWSLEQALEGVKL